MDGTESLLEWWCGVYNFWGRRSLTLMTLEWKCVLCVYLYVLVYYVNYRTQGNG